MLVIISNIIIIIWDLIINPEYKIRRYIHGSNIIKDPNIHNF